MKNTMLRLVGGILLVALMASASSLGVVSAQDNLKSKSVGGGGQLVGTWDVQVTIRDCQTNAEIGLPFPSLTAFMFGGTLVDSTSRMPQAAKTPGHGVWSHAGGNLYRFKFKAFSFGPTGTFTGWTIITHEASMDPGGNSYESAGTAEFYNSAGVLVGTGCSSTTATRFE